MTPRYFIHCYFVLMDKGPVTISYVKTDWDVLLSSGFNYHEVCLLMLIDSLLISRV